MLKVLHIEQIKKIFSFISRHKLQLTFKVPTGLQRSFLIHLANCVLLASINYYIILEAMTSTMKKLKLKMEKEEKEDCEDAQVPKSRKYSQTLVLGNIHQSFTSASPFPYV